MNRRLQKNGGFLRIDAGCQVVEYHAPGILRDGLDVLLFRLGREHVQIGNDEVALVFVLQAHPIAQATHIMAQVHAPGRAVACQHSFALSHVSTSKTKPRPPPPARNEAVNPLFLPLYQQPVALQKTGR
jgi:hypothetical protein